jgi:hypothetical protein
MDTWAEILAVPANISYPDDREKLVDAAMG